MKKIFWFWVSGFFVSDIISEVGFLTILVHVTWPTARQKYFPEVLKQDSHLSLLNFRSSF